jgi:hypothetical protein
MSTPEVHSYARPDRPPDFEVRYRFLTADEGGCKSAPRQHLRRDFLYDGDDPHRDGIFAIYPEFADVAGSTLPEGPVPYKGLAYMFILDPNMRELIHRRRIAVEGSKKIAECEVTKLIGLANPTPSAQL